MGYVDLRCKNGVTYVYESKGHWDKEKKMCVCERVCVGKRDTETGEIIFSKKYLMQQEFLRSGEGTKPGPVPSTEDRRKFYGATYLFDEISTNLGVTTDLKACFPETYKQILSIAYYLILEDRNPLSRFIKWERTHRHPFGKAIPSQRSSELFASITEEQKNHFFHLQGKRRAENEYWAYDTTSISSYSTSLKQVKYGNNKDNDPLPQINLALLFGETSNLPFYYRKLPGNIADVKTIRILLAEMNSFGFDRVKLVMDRGFYSEDNINQLYQNHLKFIVAAKVSLRFIQQEIEKIRDTIRTRANYDSDTRVYSQTMTIAWDYSQNRPYKGDTFEGKRRMYLHIYFNSDIALEHENQFNLLLDMLEYELRSGKRVPEHEKQYAKYFVVTETPKRGVTVTPKQDAISAAERNYGFFVLLSNEIKDPVAALEIYRNKDLVEKAFGNLKERLNLRRTAVSSETALDGKIFVQFIALIFLSYIKKQMSDQHLKKDFTMQELLDEIDVIECFEHPGSEPRVGEVTKKQADLFLSMGVNPPS